MRFGVRECVDVMFKAKSTRSIGSKIFYKDEPVLLFDTLTTSTLEGQGSTVYVQGGRGNARLMAWDGERTVTFTMTNALLNKESISVLTSAQLIEAGDNTDGTRGKMKNQKPLMIHTTERTTVSKKDTGSFEVELQKTPYFGTETDKDYIYVMLLDEDGDMKSEPYIATIKEGNTIQVKAIEETTNRNTKYHPTVKGFGYDIADVKKGTPVLVDYYIEKKKGAFQVEIAPEAFGGNFYIEGSTLFRDQASGRDLPAEIIIPNGKIQSNFTFTMSGSGDPSSFDFTLDAFPDYTRWDPSKKVFADIQVIYDEDGADGTLLRREYTESQDTINLDGSVSRKYDEDTKTTDIPDVSTLPGWDTENG